MPAGLFDEQFQVVPGRQAEQADLLRQVRRHLDRAGADRAGAAQKNHVFHAPANNGLVNT